MTSSPLCSVPLLRVHLCPSLNSSQRAYHVDRPQQAEGPRVRRASPVRPADASSQEALGNVQQVLGQAVTAVTGNTSTESAGAERRTKGHAEYEQARAQGYAEGTRCVC